MAIDWNRIQTKATSVRAVVTICLAVTLSMAFLFSIGSLVYLIGKPELKPDPMVLTMLGSVMTLFTSMVALALNSYFNRNDRNSPPPVGGTNA